MKHLLRIILVTAFSLTSFQAASVFAHTDGKVEVKDAWVRGGPPNARVLAAYMKIENHTGNVNKLVSVRSSAFERIEVHQTVEKDGMARMIKLDTIEIAAEGEAVLKPGGMHLMLINPKKSINVGERVSMTLEFSNGGKTIISAKVKKGSGDSRHHDDRHGHHDKEKQHDHSEQQRHKEHHDSHHDDDERHHDMHEDHGKDSHHRH